MYTSKPFNPWRKIQEKAVKIGLMYNDSTIRCFLWPGSWLLEILTPTPALLSLKKQSVTFSTSGHILISWWSEITFNGYSVAIKTQNLNLANSYLQSLTSCSLRAELWEAVNYSGCLYCTPPARGRLPLSPPNQYTAALKLIKINTCIND